MLLRMTTPTFRAIIDRWPSLSELCADTGESYETVKKWRQRNRIDPKYWQVMVAAAQGRGIPLSLSELASVARTAA